MADLPRRVTDEPPFDSWTGCLFCKTPFRQGDRGMVIGNAKADHTAELRWVHMRCLVRETTGAAGVAAYDAQWGTGYVDIERVDDDG